MSNIWPTTCVTWKMTANFQDIIQQYLVESVYESVWYWIVTELLLSNDE